MLAETAMVKPLVAILGQRPAFVAHTVAYVMMRAIEANHQTDGAFLFFNVGHSHFSAVTATNALTN